MFRPVMGCMTMVLWAGVALVLALIISSVFCDAVSTCFGLFCYCFVLLYSVVGWCLVFGCQSL
jgi:hypothetical protein